MWRLFPHPNVYLDPWQSHKEAHFTHGPPSVKQCNCQSIVFYELFVNIGRKAEFHFHAPLTVPRSWEIHDPSWSLLSLEDRWHEMNDRSSALHSSSNSVTSDKIRGLECNDGWPFARFPSHHPHHNNQDQNSHSLVPPRLKSYTGWGCLFVQVLSHWIRAFPKFTSLDRGVQTCSKFQPVHSSTAA